MESDGDWTTALPPFRRADHRPNHGADRSPRPDVRAFLVWAEWQALTESTNERSSYLIHLAYKWEGDAVVAEYGADSLRLYEMFMGPLEAVKPWQTEQIAGVVRFQKRVYGLAARVGVCSHQVLLPPSAAREHGQPQLDLIFRD